jgi:pimeloyl-ACP methyl ester carboxylesterase
MSRALIKGAFALCLLFMNSPLLMAQEEGIKNIVLVHGAFADGSCWSAVISLLQERGYHVSAVQNPLTSLRDDVTATERVLERQKGNVLLVGHSWAGAVITQAGNASNVRGLVYLSALVPDSNQSVSDALARFHAPMTGMEADKNGLIWLDEPEFFHQVMANELSIKEPAARCCAAACRRYRLSGKSEGSRLAKETVLVSHHRKRQRAESVSTGPFCP